MRIIGKDRCPSIQGGAGHETTLCMHGYCAIKIKMSSFGSCTTLLILISLRTLGGMYGRVKLYRTIKPPALFLNIRNNNYYYAGTPSILSLSLTSPIDVTSGNAVCSNTTIEFTCNASNVETFGWHINNTSLNSWYIPTTSSSLQVIERGQFEIKLYINTTNGEPPTVSSRLVGRVDEGLYNGDEIRCIGSTAVTVSQSLNLNYSLVMGKCFNSSIY